MTREQFDRWMSAYGDAWVSGNADAVLKLFTPDALYHEVPFDDPLVGHEAIRSYWVQGAREGQRDVLFDYDLLAVQGQLGIAHWRAQFIRQPKGSAVSLNGVLTAVFADSGLCIEFREWWHKRETVR